MYADETLKRSTLPAELQLVQTAVGAIRKAMTMMLKGLGNDLLYSAVHGTGLRCCFALILASSGMRIITPVAMMPANQSSVRCGSYKKRTCWLHCEALSCSNR